MTGRISTRASCFLLGGPLLGVGVSCTLRAGLGASPFDVANSGLARLLGWDVGTASWVVSALLVAAAWALGRRPRVGTLVEAFAVGLFINLSLPAIPAPVVLWQQMLLLTIGFVGVWAGATAYVCADFGAGPAEEAMLSLAGRGMGMREARWGLEAVLFAGGWALGGAAGVGSVAFVLLTGPVLAWSLPRAAEALGLPASHAVTGAPADIR